MDCTVRHNCKNFCIKKRLEGGGGGVGGQEGKELFLARCC